MESPLALYRRYRPETFAEVIGQDHVTEPLRAALFVAGLVRDVPLDLPGRGALLLDLRAPHFSCPGTLGPPDQAGASIPVPAGTSLIGVPLGIQGLFKGNGGWRLVPTLVLPAIL